MELSAGAGGSVLRWIIENTIGILKCTPDISALKAAEITGECCNKPLRHVFKKNAQENYVVFLFNALYGAVTKNSGFTLRFEGSGDKIEDLRLDGPTGSRTVFSRVKRFLTKSELFFAAEETVSHIDDSLDSLYLPKETDFLLEKMYSAVKTMRRKLLKSVTEEAPFPEIGVVRDYLNAYTSFCTEIFGTDSVFSDGEARTINFFEDCLNIDTREQDSNDKSGKRLLVSLYSPYALAALRNIYTRLSELLTSSGYAELKGSYADYFVNSVITNKLLKNFCRYYLKNGVVYYVSVNDGYCTSPLQALRGIAWTDLSSVEPVSLLDLYEKIAYFLQSADDNALRDKENIRICILGYAEVLSDKYDNANDALQLQKMVDNCNAGLAEGKTSRKITFDVYLNRRKHDENDIKLNDRLCFHEVDYDDYFAIKSFHKRIVDEFDLVFVLDAPFLFQRDIDVTTTMSANDFSRMLRLTDYDTNYRQQEKAYNKIGMLSTIGDQLIVASLNRGNSCGYICREIRTAFYDALKERIENKEKSFKEVYLLMSAENEVDIKKYDRLNVTSTENKNGRHIALVKISNNKLNNGLKVYSDTKKEDGISFDLWNLVKNIAPSLRYSLFSLKADNNSSEWKQEPSKLSYVKLNLVWNTDEKKYPGGFKLYWTADPELPDFRLFAEEEKKAGNEAQTKKEIITGMLEKLFDAIFNSMVEPAFRCMQKSFGNIFFGRSKTVNQILVYHLLQRNVLNAPVCEYSDQLKYKNEYTFNLMDKRMYFEIINTYDDENSSDMLQLYNISRTRVNNKSRDAVVDNIRKACITAGYVDSELYRNLVL